MSAKRVPRREKGWETLNNNINSTSALIETVQEQNEIDDEDDEEFFQGALDELIDFTRQEMRRQDEMIELLENILAKDWLFWRFVNKCFV